MFKLVQERRFLFFLLSWAIVSWGQPASSIPLSVCAAIFGYALFWMSIQDVEQTKHVCSLSGVWFFLVQCVQLSWFSYSEYHGIYLVFVYLFVAALMGLQFSFFMWLFPRKRNLGLLDVLGLASFWTLCEWVRLFFFCGFPFNFLGISLSASTYLAQLASYGGVFFLSFLAMLLNLLFYRIVRNRKKEECYHFFLTFSCLFLWGYLHFSYYKQHAIKEQTMWSVGLVQTGLKPENKHPLFNQEEEYYSPYQIWSDVIEDLKAAKLSTFDMIVLPEALNAYPASKEIYLLEDVKDTLKDLLGSEVVKCFPEVKNYTASNLFWAQTLANYFQSQVIVGFVDQSQGQAVNAAFHLFPYEKEFYRYDKTVLVPMGEYIPFSSLKTIAQRYGISNFFLPGSGPKVFGKEKKVAVSICFEECFPEYIRKGREKGADLFVNITNDGWFYPSKLPKQHFFHGKLRAIENGVPLLRSCNTGVTAVVDSFGEIRAALPYQREKDQILKGVLIANVSLFSYPTFYSVYGNIPILICSLFFLLIKQIHSVLFSKRFQSQKEKNITAL